MLRLLSILLVYLIDVRSMFNLLFFSFFFFSIKIDIKVNQAYHTNQYVDRMLEECKLTFLLLENYPPAEIPIDQPIILRP